MDNRRFELIIKLVEKGHVNVPERLELGNNVKREEVKNALKLLISDRKYYPTHPWKPGEVVYEGDIIEIKDAGYRIYIQGATSNPYQLVGQQVFDYDNVDDSLQKFIDANWNDNIDGIKIVE